MSNQKQPLFLRILHQGKLLDVKQFTTSQVVIGNSPERDIHLHDPSVSPIHTMVEERDGKYFLCDLGGKAGTLVGGRKIIDHQLQSGMEFQVGDHIIEFHIGVPKPKKAPPAPPASVPEPPKSEPPKSVMQMSPKSPAIPKAPVAPKAPAAPKGTAVGGGSLSSLGFSQQSSGSEGGRKYSPPSGIKGTYAPSSSADLEKVIKPDSGPVVQVIVTWYDRVLSVHHYDDNRILHVGSHPENEIVLPVIGAIQLKHPVLKLEAGMGTVCLTGAMTCEVVKDKKTHTFDDLRRAGKFLTEGVNTNLIIEQGELVRVMMGEGIVLLINYVKLPPPTRMLPPIDLTTNQLLGLGLGLAAAMLFMIFALLYPPTLGEQEKDILEPQRIAKFYYKKQPLDLSKEDKPKTGSAPENIKDKVEAPRRGEEGAAKDAPKVQKPTEKKVLTAAKPGKDSKPTIQKAETKQQAAPKEKPKTDVNKLGLLSAFGKQGMQDKLNKAFQGTGAVAGLSDSATGTGAEAAGSGYDAGSGLREVGKGGQGTATVGIAGIQTKGKGGGVSGYGTGSLGAKRNANIIAGDSEATFEGTIDKEAIRRVIKRNINQIRNCYERGLNRDPSLYGKIVVQWTIGARGKVLSAFTKSTTMNSKAVEECFVRQLRTWIFPEPPAGQEAEVSYPFVFQAQE